MATLREGWWRRAQARTGQQYDVCMLCGTTAGRAGVISRERQARGHSKTHGRRSVDRIMCQRRSTGAEAAGAAPPSSITRRFENITVPVGAVHVAGVSVMVPALRQQDALSRADLLLLPPCLSRS